MTENSKENFSTGKVPGVNLLSCVIIPLVIGIINPVIYVLLLQYMLLVAPLFTVVWKYSESLFLE